MYSLLPALVASIFLGYGIMVACTQGLTRVGASFYFLCVLSALWQGTWAVLFQVRDPHIIMGLVRFGYFVIIFLPTSLYHFLTEIAQAGRERRYVYLSYGFAGLLALADLGSDWFVSGYYEDFFGPYPRAGVLHPLHVLQTTLVVSRGLWVTYVQQRHSNASQQIKLRLCMGAVLIYFFAAVDYLCNYGVVFYPPGVIFIAISLGIFTVAIVRFNLFNPLALAAYMVVANVSHELRTPVNALRLLLDSAKRQGMAELLPQLEMLAAHMSNLVEDMLLLDPNRAENRHSACIENFDLGREIQAAARLVPRSAATFTADTAQCDGVMARGDLTALRRILVNLLSNAFKFTELGTVSLHAALVDSGTGRLVCRLEVRDTGVGIPKSLQKRIFDAFVTRGMHGKDAGMGLGLAISAELAHKLDGTLRLVGSEVNQGSTFECIVQFERAPTALQVPSAPVSRQDNARHLRVLVAEDDPITANAMRIVIGQLGHDVVHVSTYYELGAALADAETLFDIAFIDNRLPGGHGLEIVKLCRDRGWAPGTKLILTTAEATAELLTRAAGLCDDVVVKPTGAKVIHDLLERAGGTAWGTEFSPMLDRAPLAMLVKSGASKGELVQMYNLFSSSVGEALARLESGEQTERHGETLHRTQSACATMGAVALLKELRKLADDMNSHRLAHVREIFDQTKASLLEFLQELPVRA
jgi:signal transduction histidine kinase/CheY-like chemotaxis protein